VVTDVTAELLLQFIAIELILPATEGVGNTIVPDDDIT